MTDGDSSPPAPCPGRERTTCAIVSRRSAAPSRSGPPRARAPLCPARSRPSRDRAPPGFRCRGPDPPDVGRVADMRLARHAWVFVVLTAALAVTQAVLLRAGGVPLLSATAVGNGFPGITVATVAGALVGAVILSRRPRHPIGWVFCLGQLGVAAGLAARAAGDAALAGELGFPEAGRTWEWIGALLGSVFALMLLAVLLLLAPDGRLPSPRWWPALLLPPASYALLVVTLVALARPSEVGLSGQVPHASLVDPLVAASSTGVFAGLVAGAAAVVVRLVRARGEARQQMRWIAVASIGLAVVPVLAVAVNLTGRPTPLVLVLALHLAYLAVPVATGFAVLRYRLYDVDRVIGGAVVLTVLVVVASAGYLLAVAAVGRAAEDRGRPSRLAPVAFCAVRAGARRGWPSSPSSRSCWPSSRCGASPAAAPTGSSTDPGPPATRCSSRT